MTWDGNVLSLFSAIIVLASKSPIPIFTWDGGGGPFSSLVVPHMLKGGGPIKGFTGLSHSRASSSGGEAIGAGG
jgi:hypothetical protein